MFSNQKGKAIRSDDKNIRVSTHLSVLKFVVANFSDINFVIEHGMGNSSTPFFHSISAVKTIVSFENNVKWQTCSICSLHSDLKTHVIEPFDNEKLLQRLNTFDVTKTLALVDGVGDERLQALKTLQEQNVAFIVEHDAETLSLDNVLTRNVMSVKNEYAAIQYISENPESVLYIKNSQGFSYDNQKFVVF